MKRWMGIGLILALSVSLLACGEATPASIYEKAMKKYRGADTVAITVHQQLSMADGSSQLSSTLDGELRIANPDGKKALAAMDGNMSIDLGSGSAMTVPLSYYYQDEVMYANMMGTQYCMDMNWEEACEKMGPGVIPLSGLAETDFATLEMSEESEGTVLDFSITGDSVAKITGVMDQWSEFAETYSGAGSISFQSAEGKLTLEGNYPVREVMIITGTIQIGDQTIRVTEQIELSLNYEDVEVSLPELSSYQKLSSQ